MSKSNIHCERLGNSVLYSTNDHHHKKSVIVTCTLVFLFTYRCYEQKNDCLLSIDSAGPLLCILVPIIIHMTSMAELLSVMHPTDEIEEGHIYSLDRNSFI